MCVCVRVANYMFIKRGHRALQRWWSMKTTKLVAHSMNSSDTNLLFLINILLYMEIRAQYSSTSFLSAQNWYTRENETCELSAESQAFPILIPTLKPVFEEQKPLSLFYYYCPILTPHPAAPCWVNWFVLTTILITSPKRLQKKPMISGHLQPLSIFTHQ